VTNQVFLIFIKSFDSSIGCSYLATIQPSLLNAISTAIYSAIEKLFHGAGLNLLITTALNLVPFFLFWL